MPPERQFVDNGISRATLARPGLDRLRDLAAVGAIDRILCPFARPSSEDFQQPSGPYDPVSLARTPLCWPRTPKRRGPKSACRSFARSVLANAPGSSNPHERVVAVPSLWPRLGGVLQQHGLGVLRQVGVPCRHRTLADFAGVISHMPVSGQCDKRMRLGTSCPHYAKEKPPKNRAASPCTPEISVELYRASA
jgi:hypothetical protein